MLFTGRFAVEEQDVGLDPLGVKYAGGETQKCMNVAIIQQVSPYRLTRASLEQNVVRHHNGRPSMSLQQGPHVLEEVQLLVAGGGPEIWALHHEALPLGPTI